MKIKFADLKTLPPGDTDWARIDAMTEKEADANALADPDGFPTTEVSVISARARMIRLGLGLTQEEFSARYHIPLGTLRDWEQHRAEPDQATRAFLEVIAREPDVVARALAASRPAAAE